MSKVIIIREASSDELDFVEGLVIDAGENFFDFISKNNRKTWLKNIKELIRNPKGEIIVVDCNDSIHGAIQFFPEASRSSIDTWPSGAASISFIAVTRECRRMGCGSMLLQECIRRARKQKIHTIYIHVANLLNEERSFVEKSGFKRAPKLDEFPVGENEPLLAYKLDI